MKILFAFFISLLVSLVPLISFASLDMFVKIEGAGYSKIVQLGCKDGTCKKGMSMVDKFNPGSYTFTICNEKGEPLRLAKKPQRRMGTVTLAVQVTTEKYSIGKIHETEGIPLDDTSWRSMKGYFQPMRFTKTTYTNDGFSVSGEITGSGTLLIDFSGIWADGGIMFTDDWETPVDDR